MLSQVHVNAAGAREASDRTEKSQPMAATEESLKGGSDEDSAPEALFRADTVRVSQEGQTDNPDEEMDLRAETVATVMASAPERSDLLGSAGSFAWATLDQGVAQFFEKLDQLGSQLIIGQDGHGWGPWIVTAGAAGLALEMVRRKRRSIEPDLAAACPDHLTWTLGLGEPPFSE